MKSLAENLGYGVIAFILFTVLLYGAIHCGDDHQKKIDTVYKFVPETLYVENKIMVRADSVVYRYRYKSDSVPCLDGGHIDFNLPNGTASVDFSADSGAVLALNLVDTVIDTDSVPIVRENKPQRPSVAVGMVAGIGTIGPAALLKTKNADFMVNYNLRHRQINFGILIPLRIFDPSRSGKGT